MDEIEIKVTIDEANLILEGLGQLPFAKVYSLVGKIQEQAAMQLAAEGGAGTAMAGDASESPAPRLVEGSGAE